MLQFERIDVPEGIDINNTNASKDCFFFFIIGILTVLVIILNPIHVIDAMTLQWWFMN